MKKLISLYLLLLLSAFSVPGYGQKVTVLGGQKDGSSPQNRRREAPLDLLIVGATIVTMNEKREVLENGSIGIRNGEIVMIGDKVNLAGMLTRRTINAAGKVIIPGLINTHTHIPMVLFRGIADDMDLNEWLTKYIFPAEAKNVDEQFVRAGTRLGLAEMIRGGTTTYADMYYYEDAIADETKRAGVRGVLGETMIDFPVPDNKTWEAAMAYTERFVKKWQGDPLIVPALAPHAPYTVSTEHLQAVRRMSDRLNAPVLIHVAETKKERDDILAQKGATPMKYLDNIGFLGPRVIAAHTIWITDEEIDIMNRHGVGSGHCPQSNMKLAAGAAPIPAMLAKDTAVGLGTDGAASNNDLNMWEEMDSAAKLHKVVTGDPKVATAMQMLEMATIRAARALDLEKITGSIEIGKRADIAIVDMNALHQTPMFNVYSHLVYATKAADVSTVIINGRVVMLNRRLLTLNESVIKKDANLYRKKIIKSLAN